jgi:Exocyst complex component SEC3 N-terminal PIP2 binding PH
LIGLQERDLYKKKQEWQLRDLRILDGLAADSLDLRLDLGLDERFTWTCASLQEKEAFLKVGAFWGGVNFLATFGPLCLFFFAVKLPASTRRRSCREFVLGTVIYGIFV